MVRSYPFVQVDVFTDRVFGGNPLAVFPDAEGLSDAELLAIGREMNLSETTFVFPPQRPDHAARVRIVTPTQELPFAGHPTIGTAYVLATLGRLPPGAREIVLEEGVGPIRVRLEGDPAAPSFLWMDHPPAVFGAGLPDRAAIATALGLVEGDLLPGAPIASGSTGLPFLYVPLRDRAAVDRAWLDLAALRPLLPPGTPADVFVFAVDPDPRPDGATAAYSRMFAPADGIPEDPATGSASGPLGAYLVRHGLASPAADGAAVRIVSEQGAKMGRQSFVHIAVETSSGEPAAIRVGGAAVPVLDGTLRLP